MDGMPRISVDQVGQFIQRDSCLRRFKLGLNKDELAMELPFYPALKSALDPVLMEHGREMEDAWAKMLRDKGMLEIKAADLSDHITWAEMCQAMSMLPPGQAAFAREVEIDGRIEAFWMDGRMDFVILHWNGTAPRLRIVECKASRKDHTYHRMQLATYSILVRQKVNESSKTLAPTPVLEAGLEEVVARLGEEGENQDPMALPSLDLSTEREDLVLMLAEGGHLHSAYLTTKLDLLPYLISSKCDTCTFCPHCLPESARQRRLELLGLDVALLHTLRSAGIDTLDDLADLDPFSDKGRTLHRSPGFSGSVEVLVARAKGRRSTLPNAPRGEYHVTPLPYSGRGQLPPHSSDAGRLVRVYLTVEHDYLEDRIVGAAAHITDSEGLLRTPFKKMPDGKWRPAAYEDEELEGQGRPLKGVDVIHYRKETWSGDVGKDDRAEQELLSTFFHDLVTAITKVAGRDSAPVHFYIWSKIEMDELVDACERVQGGLLHHLTELLGCRQPTEQLIYSPLQDEVSSRYALGWTSRSLISATSLRWFGRSFHWVRQIGNEEVRLDRAFEQDIFDFKTTLAMREDGTWAKKTEDLPRTSFEIRTRHRDEIRSPYWHALWGDLPDVTGRQVPNLHVAMRRYRDAARTELFDAFLKARCHALRWTEERVQFKNEQIDKPSLDIVHLKDFSIERDTVRQAAIDFLRLDHHIKRGEWLSTVLLPPLDRASAGVSIPVRDVVHQGEGLLRASLDLDRLGVDPGMFREVSDLGEDSFIRISPCSQDPRDGQGVKQLLSEGLTAELKRLDMKSGLVMMRVIPHRRPDRYRLASFPPADEGMVFPFAMLDDSASDFVSGNVEGRLEQVLHHPCYSWFDTVAPNVPRREHIDTGRYGELLERLEFKGHALNPDQMKACLDGLRTRVQLLLGPPGTGKTRTTAVAVLLRLLARKEQRPIFLLGANTHTAADELHHDLEESLPQFSKAAAETFGELRPFRIMRIPRDGPDTGVRAMNDALTQGGVIMIGSTNQLLKLGREWERLMQKQFKAQALVVDEASMMVFPHFLALTTLLDEDAEVLLAGDHMQLSPIVAHDWTSESRPQARRYEPFRSCYGVAWDMARLPGIAPDQVMRSMLQRTYRLGPEVRELISPIYAAEGVMLQGRGKEDASANNDAEGMAAAWASEGMFLMLHDEDGSKKSNEFEAELIREIIGAGPRTKGSVAVITPHRAQRSLLRGKLAEFGDVVKMVDTVERLQGGECDTVIVSGTQSDPNAISASAEFILDLNRSNVIFSRAKKRLIVVCSRNLLNSVPADLETYRSAYLWKKMRHMCVDEQYYEMRDGHWVRLLKAPSR